MLVALSGFMASRWRQRSLDYYYFYARACGKLRKLVVLLLTFAGKHEAVNYYNAVFSVRQLVGASSIFPSLSVFLKALIFSSLAEVLYLPTLSLFSLFYCTLLLLLLLSLLLRSFKAPSVPPPGLWVPQGSCRHYCCYNPSNLQEKSFKL